MGKKKLNLISQQQFNTSNCPISAFYAINTFVRVIYKYKLDTKSQQNLFNYLNAI